LILVQNHPGMDSALAAAAPLTAEEKYRLLLEISEAANSQREIAAVLEAVINALPPSIPIDAVGVITVEGEMLSPHSIYIKGVERRQGDSFADVIARWLLLTTGEEAEPILKSPVAL